MAKYEVGEKVKRIEDGRIGYVTALDTETPPKKLKIDWNAPEWVPIYEITPAP